MLRSNRCCGLNRDAAEAMISTGAHAATDVTGFGVVGHLMTMMRASGYDGAVEAVNVLPVLPGVVAELLEDGRCSRRHASELGELRRERDVVTMAS